MKSYSHKSSDSERLIKFKNSNFTVRCKNQMLTLLFITLSCFTSYAQVTKNELKGNREYDNLAYSDAIKTYERIYEYGNKSPNLLYKLGTAYYFIGELEKANKLYNELYAGNQEQESEFYYRFAQTLKATKNYTKADALMSKFSAQNATDNRAKLYLKKVNYLQKIQSTSGRYTVENASINSKYSDYGVTYFGKEVVFSSARDTSSFSKRLHTWTGQHFTNLYSAHLAEDGSVNTVVKFGNKLNSKYHEDTPVFTKDGKTVYFTRNDYLKHRAYNSENVTLLKIYKANVDKDGQWSGIAALSFTSDNYQTAHPALSPDEKTLFFASDMPGTRGASDLYKVTVKEDGSFGSVLNLGTDINTEGRETYPFITDLDELYFASDGHPGLGGLDMYVTKIPKDGTNNFIEVLNLGEEANSPRDDFGLIINTKNKTGFFSSNRAGGKGNDDIYKFIETKTIWCAQSLTGILTDETTLAVLPNTKMQLLDEKLNLIKETVTNAQGEYEFLKVDCGLKYSVRASLEMYLKKEVTVEVSQETGKTVLNINLKKEFLAVKIGDDLAVFFKIKAIYFDVDKSDIRPDAEVELVKLLDILKGNKSIKIKIRSHTDSRASSTYNIKLSKKRAKATLDWLVKNGIQPYRLKSEGVGESELINNCADGVPCTEEEHQLNKRSEFIITSL